ncbi:hypothetical protein [Streptomyces sp. GESEQ-4]|uniref:hypothetical protein n=1 Tax=Streptomyces sp. GESEQ-4 TaxID=2812655 RepID=UPI001B32C8B4|nr:hypothetical protein [Streptomyces sp. GESEQ-4]
MTATTTTRHIYLRDTDTARRAHATTLSLVVVAAAIAVCLPLVGLLPRRAPAERVH